MKWLKRVDDFWFTWLACSVLLLGWASFAAWGQDRAVPGRAYGDPTLEECYLTVEWLDGYAILTLTTEADIWQTIRIREDIQLGLRSDGIVVWRKHEEERP